MNQFEAVCKLASDEGWCWNLYCTTCGHFHFRYALRELAKGRSPDSGVWIIHIDRTRYLNNLGGLPLRYSKSEKEKILQICAQSDVPNIAASCNFPDWLGYLGLVLQHMQCDSEPYRLVSARWASQLAQLIPDDSQYRSHLWEIARGNGTLSLEELERCETCLR